MRGTALLRERFERLRAAARNALEGLTCPSTASMVRGPGAAQEGQRLAMSPA
eukprot:CAMPEP_0180332248 /NCGR_PEP_ID=MMETSP0988-20121125/42419_1 /TAXON_ID=697907 /ORGANISM="non described non described, Strain CCMP2293" /LENGTH=51 /DNA_ID=CAMNT_0022319857 /DNA_START=740 /DNA_END=895 /DNA_ORIENTATION=-